MPRCWHFVAMLALAVTADASGQDVELDTFSGLKMRGDWQLVRAHCVGCHSGKLITQQRGSAEQWLTMIRWMQAKQNLWQFDPETERKIIAYLADNYAPEASRRRAAIPRHLMPPNPYADNVGDSTRGEK